MTLYTTYSGISPDYAIVFDGGIRRFFVIRRSGISPASRSGVIQRFPPTPPVGAG
jgi:hypothetical protein